MNKLLFSIASIATVLICGCVSQSDYEALSADCKAMNDRLTKIESDLYKIEIKQAPRDSSQKTEEKKFEPNKDVEIEVINTKVNAFIKEYVGVSFGDDIATVKDDDENNGRYSRNIKMVKPFKYFDKAYLEFTDGKLTCVRIDASIDKKFSAESVEKRFREVRDDLASSLGFQQDFRLPQKFRRERKSTDFYIDTGTDTYNDKYMLSITFGNRKLREELEEKRKKLGEELPEVK